MSNGNDPITQREFEIRFRELEQRFTLLVEREKEKVDLMMTARDEARNLQAREYERRLADLNHAHQLAQERNASYVPRETFDGRINPVLVRIETIEKLIANFQGKSVVIVAVFGIVVPIIVSLAVRFLGGR